MTAPVRENRIVSRLMSIPRSARRSSTLRSDSGYLTYIITTRRITSGELATTARDGPKIRLTPPLLNGRCLDDGSLDVAKDRESITNQLVRLKTRPGRAVLCCPPSTTIVPFTRTNLMPRAGLVGSSNVAASAIVSASNRTRSA
jgi:hypothetical protein